MASSNCNCFSGMGKLEDQVEPICGWDVEDCKIDVGGGCQTISICAIILLEQS